MNGFMQEIRSVLQPGEILVAGVGGGGSNAISNLAMNGEQAPKRVAIHTDSEVLAACTAPQRVQIGPDVTRGFSTGGDLNLGRTAAESDDPKLRALFSKGKLCFLITCLGGGTGSGAAPVIARIAREEGLLVFAFASLPFTFEGEDRRKVAEAGLALLREHADILVLLPNDRLSNDDGEESSFMSLLKQSDETIGLGIRSFWKLLTQTGIINLGFADLQEIAHCSGGTCAYAYAEASGRERVKEVTEALLNSPHLERGHILSRCRGLVLGLSGGPELKLSEIQAVMNELRSVTPANVNLRFGTTIDEEFQGKLSVTVLACESWRHETEIAIEKDQRQRQLDDIVRIATGTHKPADAAKNSPRQTVLDLGPPGRGRRFKDVEPTFYEGEDLDLPTFIRRGIKLSAS